MRRKSLWKLSSTDSTSRCLIRYSGVAWVNDMVHKSTCIQHLHVHVYVHVHVHVHVDVHMYMYIVPVYCTMEHVQCTCVHAMYMIMTSLTSRPSLFILCACKRAELDTGIKSKAMQTKYQGRYYSLPQIGFEPMTFSILG